jgi:hypothetical protein
MKEDRKRIRGKKLSLKFFISILPLSGISCFPSFLNEENSLSWIGASLSPFGSLRPTIFCGTENYFSGKFKIHTVY